MNILCSGDGSLSLTSLTAQPAPLSGPYATRHTTYRVSDLDLASHWVDVYYATNATRSLRFISFAHGAGGGLVIQPFVYTSLLHAMAAWGYVVAAPRASLLGECWGSYYTHQQRVID